MKDEHRNILQLIIEKLAEIDTEICLGDEFAC